MSAENMSPQPKSKKQTRKMALTIAAVLFILLGTGYAIYWFVALRHHQTTDDAYVAGNQIQIMAQISGNVTTIHVDNTDLVKQGEVLLTLDPTDAQQAFERAKTSLANSVRQTHQLIINNRQLQANIELKKTALSQAQADLTRREALGKAAVIGKEELQHARDAAASAKAELEVALQQYNSNNALVLNTPVEQHPSVLHASSQLRDAWLTLQRTKVVAPITGYISRRSVQVGSQIAVGTPLMVIVPADQIWVDANFKETQLANMRIGQPVTIISDFYGDDVEFNGTVAGLDMGTGSAFSLLPAQNATGNWIKVVQRLPVRIELDPQQVAQHPLRIGLSMDVTVNTSDKNGLVLAEKPRQGVAYQTDALTYDLTPVNHLIADIIQANSGN
ncbi:multidrug efflux MFS transporter periplasmic adaptor subunit EmrA [Pragia fontium]|uniref:Membrane fusion protein, multidrug efflux system n=2 Tax=Pragia fontium TaxID=82985 RepID=A0AAJ5BFN4_9GAMM|nr:multidrug efflux MFS transporter periplasmic adaptor subunit EmrA [Pragia fontium]AKJ41467.1 multidrug transporter [Pragia fontium]SFB97864.1 membrane fusion protein, multidrug efflux system [Pragia fontium DSM 5563 = ATCC 49100]SUB81732.1 Inner membrane protein yiaV precursor [Pragia fontium]VEJ54270.1 Inner membrane protein yiaV precursor [Pragia fontium]GKX63032.1 multidrug resistance protein A [Pragia fontium]